MTQHAEGAKSVKRLGVGILVSGRGSNMKAVLEAKVLGKLPLAEIRAVISNNPDAPALATARAHGVATVAIDHRQFLKDRAAHELAIIAELDRHGVDFVVLAGYMRVLTPTMVEHYAGRMINIHPSLLPAFPGVDAQSQAFDYGVRVSGCTVHFVTSEMDGGPIILQRTVPVLPQDDAHSLAERILVEEHRALPLAIDLYSRGRLRLAGRKVFVLPGRSSFPELDADIHPAHPVLLATGNMHKVGEMKAILNGLPLALLTTGSYPGHAEPEENGASFQANAEIKARYWQGVSGIWTLADDSGLEVDALGGRPGLHSSRYAPTAAERNAKLLGELAGLPPSKRRARFVATVVLRGPDGREFCESGTCEGQIGFDPIGDHGFGYDPIFIPDGFDGKHLAELPDEVKNRISHRSRALDKLRPILQHLY